jgi:hypothetical protein
MARSPSLSVVTTSGAYSFNSLFNLSSYFTISDPDSVGYQLLELWDSNGVPGLGQFFVNGVAQTGGHEIDVTPAAVAGTYFGVGHQSDTFWARLKLNDGTLTDWQQFTVTVPEASLSMSSVASVHQGQAINVSGLMSITDPGQNGYKQLQLWDSNGTATGGQFKVNGTLQTGGHRSMFRRSMWPTRSSLLAPRLGRIRCGRGCC